jgi:hypothetical protein
MIDVSDNVWPFFAPARRASFPRAIRGFADFLRGQTVESLWVVSGKTRALASPASLWPWAPQQRHNNELSNIGLAHVGVCQDESILVKTRFSAFGAEGETTGLHAWLRERRIGTVLLGGLNTCACVVETAKDALAQGFVCVFPDGLLADVGEPSDTAPLWHRQQVLARLVPQAGRLDSTPWPAGSALAAVAARHPLLTLRPA